MATKIWVKYKMQDLSGEIKELTRTFRNYKELSVWEMLMIKGAKKTGRIFEIVWLRGG
jgi:hypothetical protein